MFVVEARQKPDAEELSLDDPRQPKLELRWPEQSRQEPSCIWFFDQACCEFVEKPANGGYTHGDAGGRWYFDLDKIVPILPRGSYRRIVVVAGCERKLSTLPEDSRLLCTDFVVAATCNAAENGLADVQERLEKIVSSQTA